MIYDDKEFKIFFMNLCHEKDILIINIDNDDQLTKVLYIYDCYNM